MDRLVMVVAILVLAGGVAAVLARRKPDPPTQSNWAIPSQLDRADFPEADAAWLVAVFTAETCRSCAQTMAKARVLESDHVAVVEAEFGRHRDLHDRYKVESVPLVLITDAQGIVRSSFLGPPSATDLWAAVAEAREPGSTPDGCDHGQPGGQLG